MAQITAAMVKQLREMTDSPMMECKKALVEAEGDIDKAVDVLRKSGIAKAAKKAGRATTEGAVAAYVSEDGSVASLVELKCETDFVSANPKFTDFAASIAKAAAANDPADMDALMECKINENETVSEALTEMIHVIGENMKIARFARRATTGGTFSSYIHMGGKIGTIVEFALGKAETAQAEAFKVMAHDVAMQVAAAKPLCAVREEMPQSVIDHEMEIYRAQAAESGKPEAIQEKMALGRLEKFYKESTLVDQLFVKDPEKTIQQYVNGVAKELGDTIAIKAFSCFVLGDED
ncbi:MAG: elongation factor Ts [Coriobacteriia bacterium]|nr:elongation factor Ts [Coriobacteriia bacterium]MBS5477617.1 elongation factor Ts [Coriobacteriia bacterium]